MKQGRAAAQAARLVQNLRHDFKDLSRFCREAHEVTLNDKRCRKKLYNKVWKDGVRTIEGVLERCEAAAAVLGRRGLNAEIRVAALWFTFFRYDAEKIEDAARVCEHRLKNTASEYNVGELPKILGVEKAKPLVVLWQQYVDLFGVLAARVADVLTYRRAIQLWAAYVATVRRDELAEVVRELRCTNRLTRDLVFKMVHGGSLEEGSVSFDSFNSDWKIYEHHTEC